MTSQPIRRRHTGPIRSSHAVRAQRAYTQTTRQEIAALTQERLLITQHLIASSTQSEATPSPCCMLMQYSLRLSDSCGDQEIPVPGHSR
jgi:hypothetical protein